ncbi:MAG: presenilin family intramembrane aspartyl protease PSH [Candidatus Thermoplasmatota archaeon]|nr:presenilin family intramembrane aspartyl protease PSH [Candidatus Thermoplasmatota archaeon]
MKEKDMIPIIAMGLLFLVIQFLALAATEPFHAVGAKAFENPDDPANVLQVILIVIVFTAFILLIARYKKKFVKYIILFVFFMSIYYIFQAFFLVIVPSISFSVSFILAILAIILLMKYPEWYVVDILGMIIAAGIIAIFGVSISIPLTIALLSILAIYDAISVYKTKHMISLADTVVGESLPLLMVVPKKRNYSFLKETGLRKERDALFMGLGDVIVPGILASTSYFSGSFIVAISVITGSSVGFFLLMRLAARGNPQAGLPCLNGGAIIGYAISSYILFGKFIGFT